MPLGMLSGGALRIAASLCDLTQKARSKLSVLVLSLVSKWSACNLAEANGNLAKLFSSMLN